jgi:translation initiation factor 1
MNNSKLVWSDTDGDLRKSKKVDIEKNVDESSLQLKIRRLTSGKGRTIIEISDLPNNKSWCKKLAKEIKKNLGVGGAYKNNIIEFHGEKLTQIINILNNKGIKYKKIGG